MTPDPFTKEAETWQVENHSYLMTALASVREQLLRHADQNLSSDRESTSTPVRRDRRKAKPGADPPALQKICTIFGLSEFECALLLLCAGMELESSFAPLCAAAQGDPQRTYPTFSLALAALPHAHWSALTPAAPLRHWRLIEMGAGSCLTTSPLRIDERILHYLIGVSQLDDRLMSFVTPVEANDDLVLSHWELSERLVTAWSTRRAGVSLPILQLCGYETSSKLAIANVACHFLGLHLYGLPAYSLPTAASDLTQFRLLWERETLLRPIALLLDCDEQDSLDASREAAIVNLSESLQGHLILTTTARKRARLRPMLTFDIHRPTTGEQRHIWTAALGQSAHLLNGQVDRLVTQFSLSAPVIQAVCTQATVEWENQSQDLSQTQGEGESPQLPALLWDLCRSQARPRLEDLAERIDVTATWNDLVLPDNQTQILKEITAQVQQRAKVYEQWGFAGKSGRGLGISGLFAGTSGTGKTMAAEVMAGKLRLDLYRIDLSQVVSKYIGETEKNLARVFDAAEMGGAILLFDEADALFGKRSEVKDSHDRHANIEVSYLLQRMEAFRGLSILTTNLKSALDTAFMRRLRFVVQFPFPDADQRAEIWRRVFPKATPTKNLDYKRLGQLNVAGGNIRNIALNAAFIAADAEEAVMMKHVLLAAKAEYMKLERPLTEAEMRGWG
ncbi:MAG: AAA family ATPase [Leptolyngbyaceae cyanobacterium bins.59]|nr:AAA family ATPase [Leptolyngbyaceae cyanobacterium bins.59]